MSFPQTVPDDGTVQEVFSVTCPRCRGPHTFYDPKRLTNPTAPWTHWATCPSTGEPIFMHDRPAAQCVQSDPVASDCATQPQRGT